MNRRARENTNRIVAVAYLLYAVAPHFALLHHTHPDGGRTHDHGYLSARDAHDGSRVRPRDAAGRDDLVIQGPELPPGFWEPDSSVTPTAGVHDRAARGAGDRGLRAPVHVAHSHFAQDPNILALGEDRIIPSRDFAARPPRARPDIAPGDVRERAATARAPPRAV